MRLVAFPVLLALCGCTFASKHPSVTVGIASGTIGFGACYIDGVKGSTCGIVGGSTALFLGGIAALVTLIADTGSHQLPPDDELQPDDEAAVRVRTHTAPPPVLPDAGVDAAPPADAPPADAPPADAGVDSAP